MGSTHSYLRLLRAAKPSLSISMHYLTSRTVTLINPRRYKSSSDRVLLRLSSTKLKHLSDEQILALFTRGFFGGWVFKLESWVMRMGGYRLLGPPRFAGFVPPQNAPQLWHASHIPEQDLLPVGSVIVGSFQVLSSHHADHDRQPHEKERESFIDIGFGSDERRFAGCHRFVVRRCGPLPAPRTLPLLQAPEPAQKEVVNRCERERDGIEREGIEIGLESYTCNPLKNGSWAEKLSWFHGIYARLLFVDGVRAVLKGGEDNTGETKSE